MSNIFISHAEEDGDTALDLARSLETVGYSAWSYKRDSYPGPDYLDQVERAIDECKVVLVVISSDGLASGKVEHEVKWARDQGNISNSTFSGNSAGAGAGFVGGAIRYNGSSLTVANSILANNTAPLGANCACFNSFCNLGAGTNSIADDSSCGFGTTTGANGLTIGDNVNPLLDPTGLQNNGGPTQTIALQATSPAVDAIPAAQCPATDQRGVARLDNGETACDIGAFEFVDPAPVTTVKLSTTSLTLKSQKVGRTSMAKTVKLSNTGNATLSIASIVATGDFAQTNNCGASVAVKKSCSISVTFTPTQIGTRSGTLAISDNAVGSPQTVALSGVGK